MNVVAQLNASLTGRYVIEREIGRGGMATVYLARDLKHDRRVALKVLNPELGAIMGVERFLSEIRVTANLQHPNLLPLFDSGETDGLLYYVMPYVDGESLRAKLTREKQLPIDEAVRIAIAIASALDYAHRHGVVHRDLKPENVLLHEGQPLVADFGIALAVSRAGGERVTQTGLSLGTPQYMSPEQATGDRSIDGRTDIYSLGAITYEMLAGEPPHLGTTAQAIIAKLMTEEPRALSVLRRSVPPHVDDAVRCALEKLPADRFATAARFADALTHSSSPLGITAARGGSRARPGDGVLVRSLAAASVLLAGLALAGWWRASHQAPGEPVRFVITPGKNERLANPAGLPLAVSPDGRTVAYIATVGSQRLIYLRKLDDPIARALPGSDGALDVRFAPDGKSIAYWAPNPGLGEGLFKMSAEGGPATLLQKTPAFSGVGWGNAEPIVYGNGGTLWALNPRGGSPQAIVTPNAAAGEMSAGDPLVLPDGKTVVFRITTRSGRRLGVGSIAGGSHKVLDLEGTNAIAYVNGWLVFGRLDGRIVAAKVDLGSGRVNSDVVEIMRDVQVQVGGGIAAVISRNGGTAAFLRGPTGSILTVLDEHGVPLVRAPERLDYYYSAWSPDGLRVAVNVMNFAAGHVTLETRILDLGTQALSPVSAAGYQFLPAWSPDGKHIAYVKTYQAAEPGVYWVSADGSTPEERLTSGAFRDISFARDGRLFLTSDSTGPTTGAKALKDRGAPPGLERGTALYVMDPAHDRALKLVLNDPSQFAAATVSPDGRAVAYQSNETGRAEIYVRSLSSVGGQGGTGQDAGGRVQVSSGGGAEPKWSGDRRVVFRGANGAFVEATLAVTGGSLSVARRDSLFADRYGKDYEPHAFYDVHPTTRRFVVVDDASDQARVEVVTNWLTELRAKLR